MLALIIFKKSFINVNPKQQKIMLTDEPKKTTHLIFTLLANSLKHPIQTINLILARLEREGKVIGFHLF
jgi:hypothetical protein